MLLAEVAFSPAMVKPVLTVVLLAMLWTWETIHPFFNYRASRLRHAGHNVSIALLNTVLLGFLFGAATFAIARISHERSYGLLNQLNLNWWCRLGFAVLLLDAWLYLWHRANHRVPFLWRFHRMHQRIHQVGRQCKEYFSLD